MDEPGSFFLGLVVGFAVAIFLGLTCGFETERQRWCSHACGDGAGAVHDNQCFCRAEDGTLTPEGP